VENNAYIFNQPTITLQSYLALKKQNPQHSLSIARTYRLFEQTYERDKLQLFVPAIPNGDPLFKRLSRLFGRIRGCSPTADKEKCGEAALMPKNRLH